MDRESMQQAIVMYDPTGAWQGKPTSPAPAAGWSELPPELLDLVLRRLPSLADRLRFTAVCRRWLDVATRYSAPHLPRALPWLVSFHDGGSFRSLPDGERHSLRLRSGESAAAVCVGSYGRWLLFEEPPSARRGRWRRRHFLVNPLRRRPTILRLPGHCTEPPPPPPAVDDDDNDHDDDPAAPPPPPCGSRSRGSTDFAIRKIIVCSADLVIAIVNYRRSSSDVVACCRPGRSPSWSTGGTCNNSNGGGSYLQDMAFYKGKVYAVTWDGDLFAYEVLTDDDTGEPRVVVVRAERRRRRRLIIQAPPSPMLSPPMAGTLGGSMATFLVISSAAAAADSKLLMVRWMIPYDYYTAEDPTGRMAIRVFEADFETCKWLEVKSLDGQVLFVSSNSSRAISVSTQQGHGDYMEGNKIYFVDEETRWFWRLWRHASSPRNCGVYDMVTDTIQPISLGETHAINHLVKASWFFPHG